MTPRCHNCAYADECNYGRRHPWKVCHDWRPMRVSPGMGAATWVVWCAITAVFAAAVAWVRSY